MAKLFNGMINFASAIKPTGAQPLDDRTVVQSFADLLADETFGLAKYNGMLVAVVDDEQVYMLIDDKNSSDKESWVAVGSGNGSLAVETYAEAVVLATSDNIGQVIYVKTKSSYDADGEGEGVAVEYDAAPYIVIGDKSLMKLAASTASGDVTSDVAELKTKVSELETTVGNDEYGLVKDVADLKQTVEDIVIPEVPVKDVQVDGRSVLSEEGVAVITMPDLTPYALANDVTTALAGKVDAVEDSRLMTDAEGTKLAGIAEGAQVNVIETVKVNGSALEITDKAVNIEIEAPKVKGVDGADKMLSLTEAGEVKSELSIVYVKADASGDGKPYISLFGKGGTTLISNIDATDFIKDGMINSVELVDTAEGKKALRLTWNTDAGKEVVDVDVTGLLDYYYAGDGIAFNEDERKFSVDLKEGERFLVVDAAGLGIDETALWAAADAKYDATGSAAQALTDAKAHTTTEIGKLAEVYDAKGSAEAAQSAAQTYADGLNTAMDGRVKALEDIDHDSFVKVDGYVAYSEEEKTKLANIAEGAQVNVIEVVKVNGIEATVADKVAEVKVEADDIELGTAIKNGEEEKYAANTKISVVLQGIQDSIRGAIAGGVNSVAAGDTAISVNSADANNPVVSLNTETASVDTVKEGHIEIVKGNNGIYAAMYYDGDDVE